MYGEEVCRGRTGDRRKPLATWGWLAEGVGWTIVSFMGSVNAEGFFQQLKKLTFSVNTLEFGGSGGIAQGDFSPSGGLAETDFEI